MPTTSLLSNTGVSQELTTIANILSRDFGGPLTVLPRAPPSALAPATSAGEALENACRNISSTLREQYTQRTQQDCALVMADGRSIKNQNGKICYFFNTKSHGNKHHNPT